MQWGEGINMASIENKYRRYFYHVDVSPSDLNEWHPLDKESKQVGGRLCRIERAALGVSNIKTDQLCFLFTGKSNLFS